MPEKNSPERQKTGIGDRIRAIRNSLSREAFAHRLRIHPNTLKRYEDEERDPDVRFLQKLCSAYPDAIDPAWLLTGKSSQPKELFSERIKRVEDATKIIRKATESGACCPRANIHDLQLFVYQYKMDEAGATKLIEFISLGCEKEEK